MANERRTRAYNDEETVSEWILALGSHFDCGKAQASPVYEACQTIFIGEKQHKVSVGIIFYYTKVSYKEHNLRGAE